MQKVTVKLKIDESISDLKLKACRKAKIKPENVKYFRLVKKSLDARDKTDIFYSCSVEISEKIEYVEEKTYPKINSKVNVLVVGAGPSGLFCALDLLRYGFKVTLIERGQDVDARKESVNKFIKTKVLNENSNVQFGEGGAGAFSDGKLNTQVGGETVKEVINDFVKFGAPEEIAYLNKPHIGSDNLPKVVKNIRSEIISLGGTVWFNTRLTDFKIENGKISKVYLNGKEYTFDVVVLAVGHSARDVYDICMARGVYIERKDFAVGFRIEHLAKDINVAQYGEKYAALKCMPTADYKLVSHAHERGVFTFCMCPGGYVLPSSSESGGLVVNGMSNFARNGINSNSAVVVQTRQSDFPEGVLGGIEFQRKIEKLAFALGGGDYAAPVQLVKDYLANKKSVALEQVEPTYPMGYSFSNLNAILPEDMNVAIKLAIKDMGKKIKGFDEKGGVLTAVESRTSAPVRITRNDDFTSVNVNNLYPCGEGCGYAGGIVSAGADGKKVAAKLCAKFLNC